MYAMMHPNMAVPWENPEWVLGQEQRGEGKALPELGEPPPPPPAQGGGERGRVVLGTHLGQVFLLFWVKALHKITSTQSVNFEVFFELFQLLWHIEKSHAVPIEGDLA